MISSSTERENMLFILWLTAQMFIIARAELRLDPEGRNSVQVSHIGDRDPIT